MSFKKISRRQKIGEPIVIVLSADQLQPDGTYDPITDLTGWTATAKARRDDESGVVLGDFTVSPMGTTAFLLRLNSASFAPGVVAVDVRVQSPSDIVYSDTLYYELILPVTR